MILARRRFNWLFGIGGMLLVLAFGLYGGRHLLYGKSLSFYAVTGLRMPIDATMVADRDHYPLPESNEGESLLIFDVKAPQVAAYLASTPWQEDTWHQGPIPKRFMETGGPLVHPFWDLWHSPRLKYTAYGRSKAYYDGTLLIIDPKTNRVYLFDWNH